tara:strand:- start:652 stop:1500 length:849 start_codon:yes stop_codon:yes gene_type:complete
MAGLNQQLDLFVASATDISPKEHQDLMTRCWFSLAKQKRTEPIEHKFGDSWVKVSGDPQYGIATIFDNDILLFAIAQLKFNMNNNLAVGRRFQFTGYEYWKFVNKNRSGGKGYADLWASLQRLHHTYVETNIRQGSSRRHHSFVWLSDIKQSFENGRHRGYEITLPEWLYDSVVNDNLVLTLDDGYFDIRGGLERWIYLFARKTSGYSKVGWQETIENIHRKSGSKSPLKAFRRQLQKIISKGKIIDYAIEPSFDRNGLKALAFPRVSSQLRKIADRRYSDD